MRITQAIEALEAVEKADNDTYKLALIQASQAHALIAIAEELKAIREQLTKITSTKYEL